MASKNDEYEEIEVEEEDTETVSTVTYFETDYSSPCCKTSTLPSTYRPQSTSTKDFEDSSATMEVKCAEKFVRNSILREFSREFPKVSKIDNSPDGIESSELLFKKVECSSCSFITKQEAKAALILKKNTDRQTKRNDFLAHTLILRKFYDIFDLPVSDRYLRKICFKENLIISFDPGYETAMDYGASDLYLPPKDKKLISDFSERVGEFLLRIEEGDQHLITNCSSKLSINESIAGTKIISMICNDFQHIEEKKTEWYFENEKKIEKILHVVMENDQYVAFLNHKDNCNVTNRRGELDLKACGNFLQDGGIYALMRFLIFSEFIGNFQFWTMDINGKIGLCKMDVGVNRNIIINNILYRTTRIKTDLHRANCRKEVSKTYFLSSGHIVLHKWKGCSHYIHLDNNLPIPNRLAWNLENDWMNDIILSSQFEDKKNRLKTDIKTYLTEHPQIKNLLHDYLLFLLLLKPENVLEYTINFFLNMFRDY